MFQVFSDSLLIFCATITTSPKENKLDLVWNVGQPHTIGDTLSLSYQRLIFKALGSKQANLLSSLLRAHCIIFNRAKLPPCLPSTETCLSDFAVCGETMSNIHTVSCSVMGRGRPGPTAASWALKSPASPTARVRTTRLKRGLRVGVFHPHTTHRWGCGS